MKTYSIQNLYTNVYISIIHNDPKLKTSRMSFKWIKRYSSTMQYYSATKRIKHWHMRQHGWISGASCWEKTQSHLYILCDSTYMAFWERQKHRNKQQISGGQILGKGERSAYKRGSTREIWGVQELFCILSEVVATQICIGSETHRLTPKKVAFTVWKFKIA